MLQTPKRLMAASGRKVGASLWGGKVRDCTTQLNTAEVVRQLKVNPLFRIR
jgi:hypothetical protein